MRTLYEIIEAAKSGNKPTHDECYWAMLALSALSFFDKRDLREIAHGKVNKIMTPEWRANESWNRWKRALDKSPKEWVGPNNDPANPDYQKMRKAGLALLDKVMKGATDEP
jgi:hypothetical protein